MAELSTQDVVNQSQSVGDLSPSDAPATTSTPDIKVSADDTRNSVVEVDVAPKENGNHTTSNAKMDDPDDASARSDTDTSRAEGSVADTKPVKKVVAKPVSFAKYSVPKVIAATAAVKATEKAPTPTSTTPSLSLAGRPRLVAKTTNALQSKSKPFQSATPDPMQVWNKNRVTPQPSTKHLTDEELKLQYGIHLTSRIQADGDGKEAKWADIDDDEDDWAPETIEWNDGTKSTLTPADVAAQPLTKPASPSADKPKAASLSKTAAPQFTPSIGPNAIVLKLGANAERQQAQKAATLQAKAASEKSSMSNRSNPAPTPSKSPWAALPPIDRVSAIAINPQPVLSIARTPGVLTYADGPTTANTASPAKEISADDFDRRWRDSQPNQPRELYMPNSGRYEAVPEGRRRMSRNDQNFRAPAVLQRPSQTDMHAPAEPSAAFQTHRTSTDQARRRASSTISGGSGQLARRMSIKSSEIQTPSVEAHRPDFETTGRPISGDGSLSATQAPAYQAHSATEDVHSVPVPPTETDLEVQRAQQRALMKENIERARRRKIEEEQRMEAEKQERIRLKLASLGPDPKLAKKQEEEAIPINAENEQDRVKKEQIEQPLISASPATPTVNNLLPASQSPPKPPLPLASGEPQQYGMMKVHPMDSIKKPDPSLPRPMETQRLPLRERLEPSQVDQSHPETLQVPSPIVNGVRTVPEVRRTSEQDVVTSQEPSPKLPKLGSVVSDARSGWGDMRHDHRSQQISSLWGLPNKTLGNGTFDQSLAGYSPQDLSRTSSTAAGWMNGRTPHSGRSPQIQQANHIVPDNRSYSYQSVISPDQGPLAADSEADSLFPITKPAPIGPPQTHPAQHGMNGMPARPNGVDAWSNFHAVASQQERAENERLQKEAMARQEEELRTGIRQGPSYTFNETWKQVQVGDQAQRMISGTSQAAVPPPNAFGAVGSLPAGDVGPRPLNGVPGRGSRFFPQSSHPQYGYQDRRAFTYSHPEPQRSPSPPPAEDYASLHPAFDGDFTKPVVHFPQKPVVRLPPAMPPTPPSPVYVEPATAQAPPSGPAAPLTWAARVSMPPPPPPSAPLRAVSTPIVQNPSWQERFNGLLGKKASPGQTTIQTVEAVLAVTSASKEPLDVQHMLVPGASVSLPVEDFSVTVAEDDSVVTKDVESEDDLFEDREPGSLPVFKFPTDTSSRPAPKTYPSRIIMAPPPETTSMFPFMVNNWFERRQPAKELFALIRMPGATKPIKRDLSTQGAPPVSSAPSATQQISNGRPQQQRFVSGPANPPGSFRGENKSFRGRGGARRQASKAH